MCENPDCESVMPEFTGWCLTSTSPQIASCHTNGGRRSLNNLQMDAFDRVLLHQTCPTQFVGICGDGPQADSIDNPTAPSGSRKRSINKLAVDSQSSHKKFIPKLQDDPSIGQLVAFEVAQQTEEGNSNSVELCGNSNTYKCNLNTIGNATDGFVLETYPRHFGASDSAIPLAGHLSTDTIYSYDTVPVTNLMDISSNHPVSKMNHTESTCMKQSSTSIPVQVITSTEQLANCRYQRPSNSSCLTEHYTMNEIHVSNASDIKTTPLERSSSFGKQSLSYRSESNYLCLPYVQHVASNDARNKSKQINSQHQVEEWYNNTSPLQNSFKVREENTSSVDCPMKGRCPEFYAPKSDKQHDKNSKMAAFQCGEKDGPHITNANANAPEENCVRENASDSNRKSSFGALNAKAYNTFQRIEQHVVTTLNIHKNNESVESLQQQLDVLSEMRKTDHISFQLFENPSPRPVEKEFSGFPNCSSDKASLVDVDQMIGSGVTVAGFKPRAIIRKKRKITTPNDFKNSDYWHKRRKNNDSARRSRECKREREKRFYKRALELEYQNIYLRECLSFAESELAALGRSFVPPLPQIY